MLVHRSYDRTATACDAVGFTYDGINRLTETRDALNNRTTTAYDAVGNVTELSDALGPAWTLSPSAHAASLFTCRCNTNGNPSGKSTGCPRSPGKP